MVIAQPLDSFCFKQHQTLVPSWPVGSEMLPQIPSVKQWRVMVPEHSGRIQGSTLKTFLQSILSSASRIQGIPLPAHTQFLVQWRLIVPQALFSFVFLLLLMFSLYSFYNFSMVEFVYRKQ